jgi:hypothetical protein
MPTSLRLPFWDRWLPLIIYTGLILSMGVGLFGLTRLQASQAASLPTVQSERYLP